MKPALKGVGHAALITDRRPSTITLTPIQSDLSDSGRDLVNTARETRRNAEAFATSVRRFGREMPDHLDRFHEAMIAFRRTAQDLLNNG